MNRAEALEVQGKILGSKEWPMRGSREGTLGRQRNPWKRKQVLTWYQQDSQLQLQIFQ
jgi:hypothetical protein